MPTIFANPPLVELIAELRWLPQGVRVAAGDRSGLEMSAALFTQPENDELYMAFAAVAGREGFSQVERMMPPGMPSIPFQPVYRYREGGSPLGPKLFQLGLGIFTVNTTPPYTSWRDFRPVVESGIGLLLEAYGKKEPPKQFSSVALRYIDGFGEQYTRGMALRPFLEDVLGVRITLPEAITRHVPEGSNVRPRLELAVPLRSGLQMSLKLAGGKVKGKDAVIMDTSVTAGGAVEASVEAAMAAVDAAHSVIHETFVELTRSMSEIMQPREEPL